MFFHPDSSATTMKTTKSNIQTQTLDQAMNSSTSEALKDLSTLEQTDETALNANSMPTSDMDKISQKSSQTNQSITKEDIKASELTELTDETQMKDTGNDSSIQTTLSVLLKLRLVSAYHFVD